jgi:hypothetical protein
MQVTTPDFGDARSFVEGLADIEGFPVQVWLIP